MKCSKCKLPISGAFATDGTDTICLSCAGYRPGPVRKEAGPDNLAGYANKTELKFAEYLAMLERQGMIKASRYEAVKLRLADNTFYTPDFMVLKNDNQVEYQEVKGFWRDDARVKIKVAADLYSMWKFFAVKYDKGKWVYEEIKPARGNR